VVTRKRGEKDGESEECPNKRGNGVVKHAEDTNGVTEIIESREYREIKGGHLKRHVFQAQKREVSERGNKRQHTGKTES